MDWRHTAACLDEDPELCFPIGNTGPAQLQIEEAKAVCRRCDVVETCLRWALDTGQDVGVWGGLAEDERRALKRRNARAGRPISTPPRQAAPPPPPPPPPPPRVAKARTLGPEVPASRVLALIERAGMADWTDHRIANRTGMHKEGLRRIRNGSRKTVKTVTYERLCKALAVTP